MAAPVGNKNAKLAAALLKFAATRFEYLVCLKKGGVNDARFLQQSQDVAGSIVTMVTRVPDLQPEVATSLMLALQASVMDDSHKATLVVALEGKVVVNPAVAIEPAMPNNKQAFLIFPEYIQVGQRECDLLKSVDMITRLRLIALLARKMGCNYMDETSKAVATSCAFFDCQEDAYDRNFIWGIIKVLRENGAQSVKGTRRSLTSKWLKICREMLERLGCSPVFPKS